MRERWKSVEGCLVFLVLATICVAAGAGCKGEKPLAASVKKVAGVDTECEVLLSTGGAGVSRLRHIYAPDSVLVRDEWDFGNDGSVENTMTYCYDASGNLEYELFDRGNDGDVDVESGYAYEGGRRVRGYSKKSIVEFTYDSSGRLTLEEHYDQPDDVLATTKAYSYVSHGVDEILTTWSDNTQTMIRNVYDGDGRVASRELFDQGTLMERVTLAYDSQGRVISHENDFNGDGLTDQTATFVYGTCVEVPATTYGCNFAINFDDSVVGFPDPPDASLPDGPAPPDGGAP